MKFTALILTHNEIENIRECLETLCAARRIVIVDSGSTDGTLELLRSLESRIVLSEHPFHSFSEQRNFGTDSFCEPGEWVLHLDADERLTDKLAREIERLPEESNAIAYNIPSMTFHRGRAIPRATAYPVYQTRLTRAHKFHFVEVGHGQKAPPELGELPRLKNYYEHHPFRKGLSDWIRRHDRYSTLEAQEVLARQERYSIGVAMRDPISRRQWLKQFSRRLPFRPACIYLYMLIARGGFLDGQPGRDYCRMRAMYEQMIDLKVRDLRASQIHQDAMTAKEHKNV